MTATRNNMPMLLLCMLMLPVAPGTASAGAPVPLPALERVTILPVPKLIPDFALTDQNGLSRTLASLRGRPLLIFFGFTHCPDVCPAALLKLKLLHDINGGALRGAQLVMVSVDGERDTPAVMKKYLTSLSPDFIGLTGSPRAVGNIAAHFSAVAFKGEPGTDGNYKFFHSEQVFLLDKDGRLRASFFDASLENMATVTGLVLNEKG